MVRSTHDAGVATWVYQENAKEPKSELDLADDRKREVNKGN